MGCQSSKEDYAKVEPPESQASKPPANREVRQGPAATEGMGAMGHAALYNMLRGAQDSGITTLNYWSNVNRLYQRDNLVASYRDDKSKETSLHVACTLIDYKDGTDDETSDRSVVSAIRGLIKLNPDAVSMIDSRGYIPLHYVLVGPKRPATTGKMPRPRWKIRADVLKVLLAADYDASLQYLSRNNIVFDRETGGCTALYHLLQCLDDDFESPGPTVACAGVLQECSPNIVAMDNASDSDTPLSLLYRRFTRQFDLSEKFFPGDNSRPEVVQHRRRYKMAAGNTWRIIEQMLRPENTNGDHWRIVHRGILVETPPDLLRYIVETNSEDLTQVDGAGNLPLHYAAKSKPPESTFPSFYTKYVIDELLYKFPEGASIPDGEGRFPLTLAVESGKHWIGGGVKSLYDAYPDALKQIDLDSHPTLKLALESEQTSSHDDEDEPIAPNGVIPDEHHDAIMMVQRQDVSTADVVSAMWAHEEDAGVQMLGCVAVARLADAATDEVAILRIALSALAAVVNAMKAHPNEAIVQDKACSALKPLSYADNKREVSFVASGAISAVVGAMQAHVGDASVQVEACGAIADIVARGGSDRATVVASVSGLTALVNALAAHPNVEEVQVEGLRALREITDHPEANLPELPRTQTESLLEAAKSNFPKCVNNADVLLSRLS